MPQNRRLLGLVLVGAAACLWGTFAVASKTIYQLGETAPVVIGFYRLAIAAGVLLVARLVLAGGAGLRIGRADLPALLLIGLSIAGYQALFLGAVAAVGIILSSLIALCSAPVLVSLLSVLFLKQRIGPATLLAIGLAAGGVLLLVGWPGGTEAGGGQAEPRRVLAGLAMAGGAALCYAVFALASWTLAPRHHPFTLIALGFGLGALLLLPLALSAGLAVSGGAMAWAAILYIGLVATALAYALFYLGLRSVVAAATGILVLLEPLTSAVLASVIHGERLGPYGLLGGALLLAATVIVGLIRPPDRRPDRKPAGSA